MSYGPQGHESTAWRMLMGATSSWLAIVARHRDEVLGVEEAVFERKGYWKHLLGFLCPEIVWLCN